MKQLKMIKYQQNNIQVNRKYKKISNKEKHPIKTNLIINKRQKPNNLMKIFQI